MAKDDSESKEFEIDENDDDPNAIYRVINLHYYIFILIIVGVPVWWMTTRVYRADLPLEEMSSIELPPDTNKPYGVLLSLEYDILITIVNPEPENLKINLDGQLLELNLKPFLDTLSPVADFVVKSQWTYLTDLGVRPQKRNDYYMITENQLPHIITPLEKDLWSQVSTRTCINLVLYVAPCHAPLYIYDSFKNRVEMNAFLSPRWGGVQILNPDNVSCKNMTYKPTYEPIISTLIFQLKSLFHITDLNSFKISKANEMLTSTKHTLKSLAQLLSEISNIVISDSVAEKIVNAIDSMKKSEKFLQAGNIEEGLKEAKVAFNYSESAFADPSLLALLYFPDDQKYAIYIPLFLPIMIPVFMSLTYLKRWYTGDWKIKKD